MKISKKKNLYSAAAVLLLAAISIRFTYASFFTVKTNTNNQYVKTGTLNVAYGNNTTSVVVENLKPMSDEEGMGQSESSYVHIENTGNIDSNFVLTIGYDLVNFPNNTGNKLTPIDFIKVAVYEYVNANEEDLIAGPIAISDLPIYTYDSNNSNNNRYSLLTGNVGGTSSGHATKNYKIKTWLSDTAGPEVGHTYLYVNSQIVATAEESVMNYNVSGHIYENCNAVSNAKIIIHNGSYSATTNANGEFSISNLYPGVYNLDIIADTNNDHTDETYRGNITIQEGNALSISEVANVFSGNNIYNVAYSNKTTIYKIIEKNNLTGYSETVSLSSGSLAKTYLLTGGINANLQGIDINLSRSNNDFTMGNNINCN